MYETTRERHGDRLLTVYAERPKTVWAAFSQAAEREGRIAVVDGDRRLSYRELERTAASVAAGLAARGFQRGDRLAIFLPNRAEIVIAILAAARLGGVVSPLGANLRRPEIEHIFRDAEPAALIVDETLAHEPPPPDVAGPPAAMRFCVGAPAEGAEDFADLLAYENRGAPPEDVGEDDLCAILYTSGTTGRPKGAALSHLNVIHSALHWREVHRLEENEVSILAVPWSHVSGLCGVIIPMLALGGAVVMMQEFKVEPFLDLAEAERVTHALLVPAMYGLCLLRGDVASRDLSAWRIGSFGGAPMPEATISRFAEAAPSLNMCNAYGATETASPATIMPPGEGAARLDSIGKPAPCAEIVVMREDGAEAAPGEAGEIWIGGPMVAQGYWRNAEATAASFVAGYWLSGDVGSIDGEGYVRILDRKKDMVNRGGYKIYPAEVENHLVSHPDVVEAAVVGRPDEILTERVVAFVRARAPGLTAEALAAHCEDAMADYKSPDDYVIRDEDLPRNANGKIQKHELREIARGLGDSKNGAAG